MNTPFFKWLAGCAVALGIGGIGHSATITKAEAVAIAEWCYARELQTAAISLPPAEKMARIAARNRHQIEYVLRRDRIQRSHLTSESPLAYIVSFEPSGFVIVSADDALPPVLAFNSTGRFRVQDPQVSYLNHFVGRSIVAHANHRRSMPPAQRGPAHPDWRSLRNRMAIAPTGPASAANDPALFAPAADGDGRFVKLATAAWSQGNHYNEVCVDRNGGREEIVTGCTATAMAILMRYHRWPVQGNGSHTYTDTAFGQRFTHSVDFSRQTYRWSEMPLQHLTSDNDEVAKLMYHCGVAVDMDYAVATWTVWGGLELLGSGATPTAHAFNHYFRYRGTTENWSDTPLDHVADLKATILAGLPAVICTANHSLVACGYRESYNGIDGNFFFLNAGHGGEEGSGDDGWFRLGDIYDPDNFGPDKTIDLSLPFATPGNVTYVDQESGAWLPTGSLREPYRTLAEGVRNVIDDGTLMLKAGHYFGQAGNTILLDQAITIKSYLGTATLND